MADGTMKMLIRMSTPGITKGFARNFTVAERRTQDILLEGLAAAAIKSVSVLKDAAPVSDRSHAGDLRDSIGIMGGQRIVTGSARRPHVSIGAGALSKDRLFPYLQVSRTGRKSITTKRKSKPSRTLGTRALTLEGKPSGQFLPRFRAATLQFPDVSGKTIYRRRVGPWKPPSGDWVEKAEPELRQVANAEMRKAGNRMAEVMRGRGRGGVSVRRF